MANGLQVVFLCTGNTCRSPLVEALARRRFGREGLTFSSAGLAALAGEPASEGSRLVAAEQGLDLSGHRARPVTEALLAGADWIVAMTRGQATQLQARYPGFRGHVALLGLPGRDLAAGAAPGGAPEVADPHGGPLAGYRQMALQAAQLLEGWDVLFGPVTGGRP